MCPMFSPALHRQRHQFVIDYVKRKKPKKVVDLGCGECSLLKKLKFHREIEVLVGVDINGAKVKKKMHGLAPISADYLQPSFDQLCIELYQGSVTQRDCRLRGFDLVTSIELIEHLTLVEVERFSEVLFGYMAPHAVIISTPNFEFNTLFPDLAGFRHSDHKFEWTRAEFQSWAQKVCLEYGYEVEFTGVGQASSGQQETVGFCSQIGVFHCLQGRHGCNSVFDDAEDAFPYTLLERINYPSLRDNNILRRVLVNEVLYWAEELKRRWMELKTGERDATECQIDGGGEECLQATEGCMDSEETQTAEIEYLDQEGEDEEMIWTNEQGEQVSCKLRRYVSVPLAVLWSGCPKVRALSRSLTNLRHLLMDEPKVKLSQDGSAVLVEDRDLEEEDHQELDDSGYTEGSRCIYGAEQQEDWDANVTWKAQHCWDK